MSSTPSSTFATDGDRPHWAARIENTKNRITTRALRTIGWDVRIQPYTGYGTPSRIRVLAKVLYAAPRTPADYHDQPVHDMRTMAVRGFRSFTSQCVPYARVRIIAGGQEFTVRADRSGIVDTVLDVALPVGTHEIVVSTHAGNEVTAEVVVYDPRPGIGVVSDIDDTVMVTWLPRPLLAFWNAFVIHQSSRKVVRGMPLLYQEIVRHHPGLPFVYLSTGAWNVFPVLRRFLYKNGYPDGPMLLTDWGPTNTGIFRSGMDHKDRSLRMLAEALPEIRWLLVGDDGQHDPEIYGRFRAEHPEHVAGIAIRQLTDTEQVLSHGSRRAAGSGLPADGTRPERAFAAPDGFGLLEELREAGFLP
ncbi:App1 family protein [Brachybacterium sp. AOP25-B2-12]|uniref:App1 family protein n=1 Tax=Brachybacterium sp. AOP25-B2-12 TaxID=3457710 RepID=UPI00403462F2